MKSIVITGSFGNVGCNCVRTYCDRNAKTKVGENHVKIVCLDKKSPVSEAHCKALQREFGNNAFQVVWADLVKDQDLLEQTLKGVTAVVHLAAIIPPLAYKPNMLPVARAVNVDGSKNLIRAAMKANEGGQLPRFVYASSYSVMGPRNCSKPLPLVTGDTPCNPQDSYGSHKAAIERFLKAGEYKGEWVIMRIGAVSVTLAAMKALKADKYSDMLFYGVPANQRRHGVHSKDVGYAFAELAVTENPVLGKVLLAGGDDSWHLTSSQFTDGIFIALGIGRIDPRAYRLVNPDKDECYYFEDYMDTKETEELLHFQRHTYQDWQHELSHEVGHLQYYATRLVSFFVNRHLSRKSPHFKCNAEHTADPTTNMSLGQMLENKPEEW